MRNRFVRLLLAFAMALSAIVAVGASGTSVAGANPSYHGDKPGDYQEVFSYGWHNHWDWRDSKDYAFTIDQWNYCGHPETGLNWSNCVHVTVNAYIWNWDQYVQVFYAQLPDYARIDQPVSEGVPGYDNAEIRFRHDPYGRSTGYPFLYWNPDTVGGQIAWGDGVNDPCWPEGHHPGAYPWCGAGWEAMGRVVNSNDESPAPDSYADYGVNYAQLINAPFYTDLGVESREGYLKLAFWWEGDQPAFNS